MTGSLTATMKAAFAIKDSCEVPACTSVQRIPRLTKVSNSRPRPQGTRRHPVLPLADLGLHAEPLVRLRGDNSAAVGQNYFVARLSDFRGRRDASGPQLAPASEQRHVLVECNQLVALGELIDPPPEE